MSPITAPYAGRPTWGGYLVAEADVDRDLVAAAAGVVADAYTGGVAGHRAGDLAHVLEAVGVLQLIAEAVEREALLEARRPGEQGGPLLSWHVITDCVGYPNRSTAQSRHAAATRTDTTPTTPTSGNDDNADNDEAGERP